MNEEHVGTGLDIAVIGMDGRFPGAEHIGEFWENLKNGVEALSFVSDEELEQAGVNAVMIENSHFVKANGGVLENIEYFDAAFFNYTPGEAEEMAPQIRIFHEYIWAALEDAGYHPGSIGRTTGLYAGVSSTYEWEMLCNVSIASGGLTPLVSQYLRRGDFISTLISYKLNLTGPAFSIQTACSTSLAAIHLAAQGLLSGDCDMALAGGIKIRFTRNQGYMYEEGMIHSPDGHCRTFDARANGTVGGEGAGIVVLKRLEETVLDRDHIYAVIKGTAANNDGIRKVGYAAPSIEGQVDVIARAQQMAEVNPEDITYVEAHGTATALGDITEVEALKIAFNTSKKQFCALGSVKSNVGHLDTAAGVAGFIKTVLALKHRQIPPSLNFETPNPKIDFENSPFYVNTELQEWKNDPFTLKAGVSSFGIGGTNVHMVLEEWPGNSESVGQYDSESIKQETGAREYRLILLSARTAAALEKMTLNLAGYLKTNRGIDIADVSYTLQVGRGRFPFRRKFVCTNVAEAITTLSAADTRRVQTYLCKEESKPVIFMFPGLGPQYVNMGLGLYRTEPVFQKEMDQCFALLREIAGIDIKDILYPTTSHHGQEAQKIMNTPEISQYAIFIFAYSLAQLVMAWGIRPRAMIGYSFGEYAAACLSGVFSLEDALRLLKARAALISQLPPGMMLSVPLPAKDILPLLGDQLAIGIDNGSSCVVSGSYEAVTAFEQQMKERRLVCMPLYSTHGIHSPMMEPIVKEYEKQVSTISLNPPQVPYISTLTGNWIKIEDATSPVYWAKQLRETVCFTGGIQKLLTGSGSIFLEVGPGHDVSALVKREIGNEPDHNVINLIRHRKNEIPDGYYLADKIGLMWLYGVSMDWPAYHAQEKRSRVSLPPSPFERQRFWKLADDYLTGRFTPDTRRQNIAKSSGLADWFYVPSWKRKQNDKNTHEAPRVNGSWLVFIDNPGLGDTLVERLKKEQQDRVIIVKAGPGYTKQNDLEYIVRPKEYEDYETLLKVFTSTGETPGRIVHLWGVTTKDQEGSLTEFIEETLEKGFYSLLYLARAIGRNRDYKGKIEINVVTGNMQDVTGEEPLHPGKTAVLGPCMVIPQEYPHIACTSIDVVQPPTGDWQGHLLTNRLIEEIIHPNGDKVIAYRGNYRWVQVFDPVRLDEPGPAALLRQGGVYLIIGGLGNIGSTLAEYLIKRFQAKLILTGRTPLPPSEMWNQHLIIGNQEDKVYQYIEKLQHLEQQGGEVFYCSADVSDENRMQEVISQAEKRFGKINGVIHSADIFGSQSFIPIEELSPSQCQQQFQSKLYGLLTLEKLVQEKKLDYCLMISSISTILGGLGFAAYSAANHFMDAFSNQYNRKNREPWTVVNWDGTNKEDTEKAFHRILSPGIKKQVIFSRGGDLEGRISRWIKREPDHMDKHDETDKEKTGEAGSTPLYKRPALSNPYTPPRNDMERKLAHIWQEFFGIEKIGVTDDLFDLGGDSLKAINILSIIHKELNVTIPIKEFFENSTIEGAARYLTHQEKQEYISIEPAEKKEYYALSSAQQRLYIFQQMNPDSIGYNTVIVDLLEGDIHEMKLVEVFKKLITRHESLRSSIEMIHDQPVQRVHESEAIDFSMEHYHLHDQAPGSFETSVEKIVNAFVRPFDLSRAPILRIGLTNIGSQPARTRCILMVDMHHIVTDGVSHEIFEKEIAALYREEELPGLKLQYKDYAQWQNNPLYAKKIPKQQEYWLDQFKGEIPVLNMPYDYPRPDRLEGQGDSITFKLEKELKHQMEQLVKQTGTTLFMLILATYNILLSIYSGQEDIVVGIPITGRADAALQNIIGFFINMLPMRNFPRGNKTFLEFLEEVKINSLNAFENQDYQFEELVRKLDLHGHLNRNPLFDAVLSIQTREPGEINNDPLPVKNSSGLRVTPIEFKKKQTRFDLLLRAIEGFDTILIRLEYSTELFKRSTADQMKEHYLDILDQVVKNKQVELKNIQVSHDLLAAAADIHNEENFIDFEF